jgi:hypothetical protein
MDEVEKLERVEAAWGGKTVSEVVELLSRDKPEDLTAERESEVDEVVWLLAVRALAFYQDLLSAGTPRDKDEAGRKLDLLDEVAGVMRPRARDEGRFQVSA